MIKYFIWNTKDSLKSKFSSAKLERIAGPATVRNITTVQKLVAKYD